MSEKAPGSTYKPHVGMRAMEERTEQALDQNRMEREEQDRRAAIDARATTKEVSALNDTAEMEIFGSRGRTYTDPETGKIIATSDRPINGKLEDIRSNPKYGKTEAERQEAATEYEAQLENLLHDGFELTQAKLILDLGENDQERFGKQVGLRISAGENEQDAIAQVRAQMEKARLKRIEFIRENGVFSMAEYEAAKRGEKISPSQGAEAATGSDEVRTEEEILTEEEKKNAQIWADASSLDRVEMVNAGAGQNKASTLGEAGSDVLKNLDKIKGKKAAEIVRKAQENGYVLSKDAAGNFTPDQQDNPTTSPNVTGKKSDAENWASAVTMNTDTATVSDMDDDTKKRNDAYLKEWEKSHINAEQKRNADMVTLFRKLDSNERTKIYEAAFGDKMTEKIDELEDEGIYNIEDLLKNESILAGIVNAAVNNGYHVPEGLTRQKYSNGDGVDAQPLPGSFGEQGTQVIDTQDADADILEQVDERSRSRRVFGRLKGIFEKTKGLNTREKVVIVAGAVAAAGTVIVASRYFAGDTEAMKGAATIAKDSAKAVIGNRFDDAHYGGGFMDYLNNQPANGSESLSFNYPWDWASQVVGSSNAETWLHELGDKAAAAGHDVVWHGSGAREWVEIDGNSNTLDSIKTLRDFAQK